MELFYQDEGKKLPLRLRDRKKCDRERRIRSGQKSQIEIHAVTSCGKGS